MKQTYKVNGKFEELNGGRFSMSNFNKKKFKIAHQQSESYEISEFESVRTPRGMEEGAQFDTTMHLKAFKTYHEVNRLNEESGNVSEGGYNTKTVSKSQKCIVKNAEDSSIHSVSVNKMKLIKKNIPHPQNSKEKKPEKKA